MAKPSQCTKGAKGGVAPVKAPCRCCCLLGEQEERQGKGKGQEDREEDKVLVVGEESETMEGRGIGGKRENRPSKRW